MLSFKTRDVKVGLLHQLRSRAFGPYLDPRSHMIDPLKFLVIKINGCFVLFHYSRGIILELASAHKRTPSLNMADEALSIYDEIEIEDMTFDPNLQIYHYPCPCGDRFEIAIDDLRDGEDIAVCPSCSLMIRVIFEVVCLPVSASTES